MEMYNNEEYLKQQIMESSRHQFIYGYDGKKRKNFLENMADDYPIVLDKNSPIAIYVHEIGFPKLSLNNRKVDQIKINAISREFLNFSIASEIVLKANTISARDVLNERMKNLTEILNKYSLNKDFSKIVDLDDLLSVLLQSKEFYQKYYLEYYQKGIETLSIEDIALPFMELDMFVTLWKKAIKNDSYFGIIMDKQSEIAFSSTQAINSLVGGRINKDISMKIAVEPDKWSYYKDFNGNFIEYVHDYGTLELDDSQKKYLKRMKEKR